MNHRLGIFCAFLMGIALSVLFQNCGEWKPRPVSLDSNIIGPSVNPNEPLTVTPTPPTPRGPGQWSVEASGQPIISIESDGLTVTKDSRPGDFNASAYSDFELSSGRWYYEAEVVEVLSGTGLRVGIAATVGRVPVDGTTASASYGYGFLGEVQMHVDGGFERGTMNTAPVADGDIVGVAFDLNEGIISFYVNGVFQSDQAVDTDGFVYSALFHGNRGSNGTVRANFGSQPFRYSPPAGFRGIDSN